MNRLLLRDPVGGGKLLSPSSPNADLKPLVHADDWSEPIGVTEQVLETEDHKSAYPIVEDVPILVGPERLTRDAAEPVTIEGSHFEEAYQERQLYTALAGGTIGEKASRSLERLYSEVPPETFPSDITHWIEGGTTANPYRLAMEHIGSVHGETVLQIGGVGSHALRLLHAGAEHAVIVSPIVGELIQGLAMAHSLGVSDRTTFVGGVAEELPLVDSSFSVVYSGSSLHHTVTGLSFPEIRRVLAPGGRFASIDVWKGVFHESGTRMFGKFHGNSFCSPIDQQRLDEVFRPFPDATASFHGCLFRYPMAVLSRLGVVLPPRASLALSRTEDSIPFGPLTESLASIVCVRGVAA